MKKLIETLKGFLIGIANLIPGVSGGTIAVVTGIYDTLIYNLGQFFKHPLVAIKSLLFIILGAFLGIVSGYFLIGKFLLPLLPLEMAFLFSGLIIGGLKPLIKEAQSDERKIGGTILFIIMFLLLIVLALVKVFYNREGVYVEFNFINTLILFSLGVIAASAMVVPGVSGSIILLALGYYEPIINLISVTVKEVFAFKFTGNFLMLFLFGIGIILGIVFVSKLITYLLKKHHNLTFKAILGLVMGSIISVIIIGFGSVSYDKYFYIHLIASLILMGVGTYLGYLMSKLSYQKESEGELENAN